MSPFQGEIRLRIAHLHRNGNAPRESLRGLPNLGSEVLGHAVDAALQVSSLQPPVGRLIDEAPRVELYRIEVLPLFKYSAKSALSTLL